MYYLQSRYFDPETGRYLNADNPMNVNPDVANGLNLYIYCYNNPVISMVNSISTAGNLTHSIKSINLVPIPDWIEVVVTAVDHASTTVVPSYFALWGGITKTGRSFLDFHYAAYGIKKYDALDDLAKPFSKVTKGIGIALIGVNLGLDIYNSMQQGYSFGQGATSFALTAAKDIGIYVASAKLGTLIGGAIGGPLGLVVGAAAGIVVGVVIDLVGNVVIEWVMSWWD